MIGSVWPGKLTRKCWRSPLKAGVGVVKDLQDFLQKRNFLCHFEIWIQVEFLETWCCRVDFCLFLCCCCFSIMAAPVAVRRLLSRFSGGASAVAASLPLAVVFCVLSLAVVYSLPAERGGQWGSVSHTETPGFARPQCCLGCRGHFSLSVQCCLWMGGAHYPARLEWTFR